MSSHPTRVLTLAALLSMPWWASSAAAQEAPGAAPEGDAATDEAAAEGEEEADVQALPIVPFAPDERGGRFLLTLEGQLGVPLGGDRFAELGLGPGVAVSVGYAVHRNVSLGLWGAHQRYAAASECEGCDSVPHSSVGLDVTYYLVQGLRLDPWARLGAGYTLSELEAGGETLSTQGLGLRFSLGADWHLAGPMLIGPYAGLDVAPEPLTSTDGGPAETTWALHFGLRLRFTL